MRWNRRPLPPKESIIIFFFLCFCHQQAQSPAGHDHELSPVLSGNPYRKVEAIPLPTGYRRVVVGKNSFAEWLRLVPLKRDRTVYLFDGSPKRNQDAQFAVLDISVGHKDLQQCADAIMRLRAEFLYAQRDFADIDFYTGEGVRLNFGEWAGGTRFRLVGNSLIRYAMQPAASFCDDRACFTRYLETVFSYCGTLTLEKQLTPADSFDDMQIGDVLIRGGAPGHAMLIMDMAVDSMGHRVYLLAQSYMPAQDIHLVRNPSDKSISPWYRMDKGEPDIITPEWTFYTRQLRSWPNLTSQVTDK